MRTTPTPVSARARSRVVILVLFPGVLGAAALGGCGGDGNASAGGGTATTATSTAATGGGGAGGAGVGGGGAGGGGGCIAPGADDQTSVATAFDTVEPGGTICLAAGTFHLTKQLEVAAAGVTVKGAGQGETILDFGHQILGANGIYITADGVTIRDLEVLDTSGNAIRAQAVKDVAFEHVTTAWTAEASSKNGGYGLYPVQCDGVKIDGCKANGASDTGFYVGQSRHVLITGSEAFGNVAGIEIENSTDSEVTDNHVHDNAGGVLVFNLPNLPIEGGQRANVHDNLIENNNGMNFGSGTVSGVPIGSGCFVLASDGNEIHHNTIRGNDTFGVAILDRIGVVALLFDSFTDPNFDVYAQGNDVHDNVFADNGTHPDPNVDAVLGGVNPIPPIVWDGCYDPAIPNADQSQTNCVENNTDAGGPAAYVEGGIPANMGACGDVAAEQAYSGSPACAHPALAAQTGKH